MRERYVSARERLCLCVCVCEGERERTQNSVLYYTRIKILGSCLFLQSVPANLHANRLHMKQ